MTPSGAGPDPRYARQRALDAVGPEGRAALADAAVLVVGLGGLGSPAVARLAAAGVGRLGLADHDAVERSNLQRQVVHGDADVGRPKVESAAAFVAGRNSGVAVERHERRVDADGAAGLVEGYDAVVDATDDFAARFALNDACVARGVPLVHGAAARSAGQVTTFAGGRPCYRCLLPAAPPPGAVPDCAETGVLGAVPGLVGSLQATEAVKLLTGAGDPLVGRLLAVDAAAMRFETVDLAPRPDCPTCGERRRRD